MGKKGSIRPRPHTSSSRSAGGPHRTSPPLSALPAFEAAAAAGGGGGGAGRTRRARPHMASSAPASALLSSDAAVAFTTVLKEAIRVAKGLSESQVQDAAEDLQLSLLRVPGARASLDLLPGLRLPGQLVNFLRSAGESLISDAACASNALAEWCTERRSCPLVESLEVAKPTLVNAARDMMGRALPETDWGLLGSTLAIAMPTLPLGIRVGLMEGASRDALWGFVVQAIARADSGAALDTVRTILSAALVPGASEPAWVADAMPGPVRPSTPASAPTPSASWGVCLAVAGPSRPPTAHPFSPHVPLAPAGPARARLWPRSPVRLLRRPPARPWRRTRGLPLRRGPCPALLMCG